jgi:hypothetical protein
MKKALVLFGALALIGINVSQTLELKSSDGSISLALMAKQATAQTESGDGGYTGGGGGGTGYTGICRCHTSENSCRDGNAISFRPRCYTCTATTYGSC